MKPIWILLVGLWIAQGCTKVVNVAPLRTPDNGGDTTRDVRKMLDSVPQFSLFSYACSKTGVTSSMQPNVFYTLFVPTDSAMKAAGLTQSAIDQLPTDTLTKIVQYLITYGALSDTALNTAMVSVQQSSLLQTTLFSPQASGSPGYSTYRHSLYVKRYNGLLNINGWVVDGGQGVTRASNGYLYPINQVLLAPTLKLSDIVFKRPEFSFYAAAIETLDSIYRYTSYNGADQPNEDTVLFSNLVLEENSIYFSGGLAPYSRYPTVFAPTNTAFINAGFADAAAVKQWVLSGVGTDTIWYSPTYYETWNVPGQGQYKTPAGYYTCCAYYYPEADSVMKAHYLFPTTEVNGEPFATLLCYSDLTQCPSINSGVLNLSSLPPNYNGEASISQFNLQYHAAAGGVLNIQWNAAGTNNVAVPLDENQQTQQHTFWTMNGVIYATDQLFYQH